MPKPDALRRAVEEAARKLPLFDEKYCLSCGAKSSWDSIRLCDVAAQAHEEWCVVPVFLRAISALDAAPDVGVEEAAKSIHVACDGIRWDRCGSGCQDLRRKQARAALRALGFDTDTRDGGQHIKASAEASDGLAAAGATPARRPTSHTEPSGPDAEDMSGSVQSSPEQAGGGSNPSWSAFLEHQDRVGRDLQATAMFSATRSPSGGGSTTTPKGGDADALHAMRIRAVHMQPDNATNPSSGRPGEGAPLIAGENIRDGASIYIGGDGKAYQEQCWWCGSVDRKVRGECLAGEQREECDDPWHDAKGEA